ncbi:F0F1 ATP synthase subunit A [Conexibacter sp. DBS9H8]|uniref:F0F1 ATP synthase subunit A n=1 Tax=Conexibacter sp. DBS9H8 TaxID=2937801 RepID=UPI00200C1DE3|nr:F0F1 ATP synthase subunit A [Conexibacter sp. DBS9H8]
MSAITAPSPGPTKSGMSTAKKVGLGLFGFWLAGLIFFIAVFGFKSHKAPAVASGVFTPTNEFKLDTWFAVGPIDFNKGVLYVLLAAVLTIGILGYTVRRLRRRPGRLQVAVESFYNLTDSLAGDNLPGEDMARKYFPLIATLFVFILVTNLIGYIPLPVNSIDKFTIFGAHLPSFQIYAADTNVAFPLMLALMVFALFSWERLKHNHYNPLAFFKSLMPSGVSGPIVPLIFVIEILSYFLRLISLTVRLWANLLAGHMLIAFMGGELGVLVGDQWVQWLLLPLGIAIYAFEAVLIAALQAFIFSILTAIYLGDAVTSH